MTSKSHEEETKNPVEAIISRESYQHLPSMVSSFSKLHASYGSMPGQMQGYPPGYMFPYDYAARAFANYGHVPSTDQSYYSGHFAYGLPYAAGDGQLMSFPQVPAASSQSPTEAKHSANPSSATTVQPLPFTLFPPPPTQWFVPPPPPATVTTSSTVSTSSTATVDGAEEPDTDAHSSQTSPAPSAMLSPQTSKLLQSAIESDADSLMDLSPRHDPFGGPTSTNAMTLQAASSNNTAAGTSEVSSYYATDTSTEPSRMQYDYSLEHLKLPSCQYAAAVAAQAAAMSGAYAQDAAAVPPETAAVSNTYSQDASAVQPTTSGALPTHVQDAAAIQPETAAASATFPQVASDSDDDEEDDDETESDDSSSADDDLDSNISSSSDVELKEEENRVESPFTRIRPSLLKSFRASKNYKEKKRQKTRKLELMSPLSPPPPPATPQQRQTDTSKKATVSKQDIKLQTSGLESETGESTTEDESEPRTPLTPAAVAAAGASCSPASVATPLITAASTVEPAARNCNDSLNSVTPAAANLNDVTPAAANLSDVTPAVDNLGLSVAIPSLSVIHTQSLNYHSGAVMVPNNAVARTTTSQVVCVTGATYGDTAYAVSSSNAGARIRLGDATGTPTHTCDVNSMQAPVDMSSTAALSSRFSATFPNDHTGVSAEVDSLPATSVASAPTYEPRPFVSYAVEQQIPSSCASETSMASMTLPAMYRTSQPYYTNTYTSYNWSSLDYITRTSYEEPLTEDSKSTLEVNLQSDMTNNESVSIPTVVEQEDDYITSSESEDEVDDDVDRHAYETDASLTEYVSIDDPSVETIIPIQAGIVPKEDNAPSASVMTVSETDIESSAPIMTVSQTDMESSVPVMTVSETDMESSVPVMTVSETDMESSAPVMTVSQTDMESSAPVMTVSQTDMESSVPIMTVSQTDSLHGAVVVHGRDEKAALLSEPDSKRSDRSEEATELESVSTLPDVVTSFNDSQSSITVVETSNAAPMSIQPPTSRKSTSITATAFQPVPNTMCTFSANKTQLHVVSDAAKKQQAPAGDKQQQQQQQVLLPIRSCGEGRYMLITPIIVEPVETVVTDAAAPMTSELSESPVADITPAIRQDSDEPKAYGNQVQGRVPDTLDVADKVTKAKKGSASVRKSTPGARKVNIILPKPWVVRKDIPTRFSSEKTSVMRDSPAPSGPSIVQGSYCVDCNKMYTSGCPDHEQNYARIDDACMTSRARTSVPQQLGLKLMYEQNSPDFIAVIAHAFIPCRTQFGPLQGLRTTRDALSSPENLAYVWEVFDECSPNNMVLDCRDEEQSNWLMFVKRARSSVEQNMNVYQQGHDIYFITVKDIQSNTELLYWYASDYARLLGVCEKPEDCFRCQSCHRRFSDVQTLRAHTKSAHPHLEKCTHACSECGKVFALPSKLAAHMDTHKGVQPYQCKTCGAKFNNKSNLNRHQKLHNGESNKRFECPHCGKRFSQKTHLDNHVVIHSDEREQHCRFCDVRFKRRVDCLRHEQQVHMLGKQYTCTEKGCDKVFYKLDNYKKHLLIHRGIRRFSCHVCDRQFQQKVHLKTHLTRIHKTGLPDS